MPRSWHAASLPPLLRVTAEPFRKNEETNDNYGKRRWEDLPSLILEQIASKVDPRTSVAFALVCRSWHASSLPFYTQRNASLPLLLRVTDPIDSKCYLYDPWTTNLTFAVDVPALSGETSVVCAQNRWLVVVKPPDSLFALNPVTGVKIDLPRIPWWFDAIDKKISLTKNPPIRTPGWMIYVITIPKSGLKVYSVWEEGKKKWDHAVFVNNIDFPLSSCSCNAFSDSILYVNTRGTIHLYEPSDRNSYSMNCDIDPSQDFLNVPHYIMEHFHEDVLYYVLSDRPSGLGPIIRLFKLKCGNYFEAIEELPDDVSVFLDEEEGMVMNTTMSPVQLSSAVSKSGNKVYFPITYATTDGAVVDARVVKISSRDDILYYFAQTKPSLYAGRLHKAEPLCYSCEDKFYPEEFHLREEDRYAKSFWFVPNFD